MGNLAKGKLPIEKDVWSNAEQATNGNHTKYDGRSGWASARHPANFTIDLEQNHPIKQVRVLLFDGLGHSNNRDPRKYQFEIRLSEDGENFFPFFSNRGGGGNGWFIIDFVNDVSARYFQFVGIHNDANANIHLVELEVYDAPPKELPQSTNQQRGIAGGTMPNSKYFNDLIKQALADAGSDMEKIRSQRERIEFAVKKATEDADLITLTKRASTFEQAVIDGKSRLLYWSIASLVIAFLTTGILLFFIFCDDSSSHKLCEIVTNFGDAHTVEYFGSGQVFLHYSMILYVVSRFLLLSLLLFLLSWTLKNYRTERHNVLINQHKALSISTAVQLNSDDSLKDTPKGEIILEAIRTVFSHQGTGFDKSDKTDNAGVSVFNNVKEMVK